jgi:endonuclease/exonuclease/phosphatase family metal-dependent hydrolase
MDLISLLANMRKFSYILFISVLSLLSPLSGEAQADTISFVQYNLLWFPQDKDTRIDTLKGILSYLAPDLLLVDEVKSGAGADMILYDGLTEDSTHQYKMSKFQGDWGSSIVLYYNALKFQLIKQHSIAAKPRSIEMYQLLHVNQEAKGGADSTWVHIYACHLKAGNLDMKLRYESIVALAQYIEDTGYKENMIFAGDLNMYSANTEPGWKHLTDATGLNLQDPIGQVGDWHNNSDYAKYHTQSTRVTNLGNGASGGMDDRFDLVLVGEEMMRPENDITYLQGSYRAVGQDGLHFNKALIAPPKNESEPGEIIRKLYYMSDHLPVFVQFKLGH